MKRFPYNLQFFAEGDGGGAGDGAGNNAGTPPANSTPPNKDNNPAVNQNPKAPSASDIAAEILKVTEARTQRAEAGVVKSMAEQYGISEEEAKAALEKAKSEKAAKLPPEVQKRLDEAEAKVRRMQISAEVAKTGAELGLVDPEVAMTLIPVDAIKIDTKGVISGVKEALEKLKTDKPYLFTQPQKPASTGVRQGAANNNAGTLTEAERAAVWGGKPPKENKE